jgi:MFS transporter, PPP family, 3-phenylpropionic acid transporter
MTTVREAQGIFSPELRASIYHFMVFASTGVSSVYFAIWLSNRGITPDETGIITAVPVLVMLAINVLVGRIADKANDWRSVIIILSLIAGAVPIGLFFVSGFWGILLLWTLCVVPAAALVPVIDAATLRMTQRRNTNFGVVRAWGTVGYMAIAAVAGPIISLAGEGAFLPLFLALSLLRALISLQLPRFRAPEHVVTAATKPKSKLRDALKPWFVLPLIGLGIVYSTNGVLANFGALMWRNQGIDEGLIGPLIAVGAAAEAATMFFWRKLDIKVSARHLMIFAALVGVVRWGAMAFSPPIWVLVLLQLLHSITFAVSYFGGIYFIANWTNEDIAAEAQGFSYVLQQGMTVVALLGFGWFTAQFGNGAWFALAGFSLVGGGFVWLSLLLKPARA